MSYEPQRFDFSIPVRVNLSSDTQTRPSRAMKEAMVEAEVGDEQPGSDPTTWALCDRMAALLGKEAAVFLPSGTMCNEVAFLAIAGPATRCWPTRSAHPACEAARPGARRREVERPARQPRPVRGRRRSERSAPARNAPPQRMVEVEQTANLGGGRVGRAAQLSASPTAPTRTA